MNIHIILKEYRKELGLTQQEMCQGVISPSYYSKVESGIHRLTAEDLLLILMKNNISLDDFLIKINDKDDCAAAFEYYVDTLSKATYNDDLDALEAIRTKIEKEDDLDKETLYSLLKLAKLSLKNTIPESTTKNELASEDIHLLLKYFENKKNWSVYSISLFKALITNTDVEDTFLILKNKYNCWDNKIEKDNKMETAIMDVLITFITECIRQNQDELTPDYIFLLNEISHSLECMWANLLTIYLENLIVYRKTNKKAYLQPIHSIIDMFRMLKMDVFADHLKTYFDTYKVRTY